MQTLQALAKYHLQQVKPKAIIAITGSNGKTTTKELVNAVLATTYQTHFTKGNLNNHIGIPITILQMQFGTEIAIIEMVPIIKKKLKAIVPLYSQLMVLLQIVVKHT
ncbi:MAG: Mur ligase family protein [Chitinophagales bacterium]